MRTNYVGHDATYQRYRSEGAVGWDQTDAAYREHESALDGVLGAGLAPKTGRLIELGCGAGNITVWLSARGYDVLGVDISPTAVQWATERARAEGLSARFLVGDVLDLTQVEDGAFDLVLDGHCLHCIIGPDRPRFFASAHRLLAAGGYLLVDTMCGPVTDTTVFEGYDPISRCTLHGDLATRYVGDPEEISEGGGERRVPDPPFGDRPRRGPVEPDRGSRQAVVKGRRHRLPPRGGASSTGGVAMPGRPHRRRARPPLPAARVRGVGAGAGVRAAVGVGVALVSAGLVPGTPHRRISPAAAPSSLDPHRGPGNGPFMPSLDRAEHLVVRETFEAAALVAAHPPRFTHPNKRLVHGLAVRPNAPPGGVLVYSRWRAMPLPEVVPATVPTYEMREDVFGYEPAAAGASAWTMNFADPHLFVAYGGALLAQDELQVLEHPALGSLCEALRASKDPRLQPVTVEEGVSTPVLVRGVERRCALATDPDPFEGRPLGLYGNRFARANEDAVRRAVTVLEPPTISNILAMSAPPGGRGRYTEAEVRDILVTAYTGFRAARLDAELAVGSTTIVVSTGHWGTGAFGGDKVLMAVLQMIAARLAGVGALVYHTVDATGSEPYQEAKRRVDALLPEGAAPRVADLVQGVHAMGFSWGVSDGN